jgi:hypothetical protein
MLTLIGGFWLAGLDSDFAGALGAGTSCPNAEASKNAIGMAMTHFVLNTLKL